MEKLRRKFGSWASSSDGWRVRVEARTSVRYIDESVSVSVNCEAMEASLKSITLFPASTYTTLATPRALIVERVVKALEFRGWSVGVDWEV